MTVVTVEQHQPAAPAAPQEAEPDDKRAHGHLVVLKRGVDPVPPPTTITARPPRDLKRSKLSSSSASALLPSRKAFQASENDLADVLIVCEPEQSSLMMGGLHPRGALYERAVNVDEARAQHAQFRSLVREHGVRVLTVREILAYNVAENMSARVDLEDLAFSAMDYELAPGHHVADLAESDRHFISDEYKREVLEAMSIGQLVDTVMTQPTVRLTPSRRDTGLVAAYTFEPLSNLVFTRDQQITTLKGVVMGRLRSAQRQREVQVMRFCLQKLALDIVGEVREPGFLEGGDFVPISADLAMVGVGLRTNAAACAQLMDEDLVGTRRLAVVRDEFDQHQDRMHLDCVFSVLTDSCCLMLESVMGEQSATRRLVDEYVRNPATGQYRLHREGVELSAFVGGEGFRVIPIGAAHPYACNVLNLGAGRILSAHAESARQIVRSPHFQGDVRVLDFSAITSLYGSLHCASQVVRRTTAGARPPPL